MSLLGAVPRPVSLTDSAYEEIRGAILDGEIAPGERLSVVAVSHSLNMSRSPVRAAMERIASEGLLEDRGNGFVVADLTPDALFDAMEVRELLEGRAAELAALRFPQSALKDLAEIYDQFAAAYKGADARLAKRADLAFHQAIQSHCGNHALIEHLDRVQSRIMVVTYSKAWSMHSQGEGVPEHAAILAAIRLGDPLLARIAATSHVHTAKERLKVLWTAKQNAVADELTQTEGDGIDSA